MFYLNKKKMAITVDGEKYILVNGFIYRRLKKPVPYKLNSTQKEQRKLYMRQYRLRKNRENKSEWLRKMSKTQKLLHKQQAECAECAESE